jgi:hypothetical protein
MVTVTDQAPRRHWVFTDHPGEDHRIPRAAARCRLPPTTVKAPTQ